MKWAGQQRSWREQGARKWHKYSTLYEVLFQVQKIYKKNKIGDMMGNRLMLS